MNTQISDPPRRSAKSANSPVAGTARRIPTPTRTRQAQAFLTALRGTGLQGLVNGGDTVLLLDLLLTHPCPPSDLAPLKAALVRTLPAGLRPAERALRLRDAADTAKQTLRRVDQVRKLVLVLTRHAIHFSATPAERMQLVALLQQAACMSGPPGQGAVSRLSKEEDAILERSAAWAAVFVQTRAVLSAAIAEVSEPRPFARWPVEDLHSAVVAIHWHYQELHMALDGRDLKSVAGQLDDFMGAGLPLWKRLVAAISAKDVDTSPQDFAAAQAKAQGLVILALENSVATGLKPRNSTAGSTTITLAPQAADPDTLIVCTQPILRSNDRVDKDEVERHLILESPLPKALLPSVDRLEASLSRLVAEFPWGQDVIETIFGDLLGRATLGLRDLLMPPTILVGTAGSGKSRLMHRIAEELGLPRLDLALGGNGDTKQLGGTSRGWGCGKPSDLATLMATRKTASAIVLLDELDKATNHVREDAGIQFYLLALLEPETASRHMDVFLKTTCDYSRVLWLATANRLSPLPGPLLSRLRVLHLCQPMPEHFGVIAETVLAEQAREWEVDRAVLPSLAELDLPLGELRSARQVRQAVIDTVTQWARSIQRH